MNKRQILTGSLFIFIVLLYACTPHSTVLYEAPDPSKATTPKSSPAEKQETVFEVFQNGQFVVTTLDKKPMPVGDEMNFYRAMYKQMRYPAIAREKSIGGTVLISVILNELGQLENANIAKGIGYGCDEEALNAVKRGFQNTEFVPAMKDGKAVKVRYDIPVNFKLE